ncbi:MAG: DivIVA domain-containing protein [Clostridiales bacterium]|jgi:cell division initiation protein|nr:DivIVA domain-containing protein [Clostridiales bacterium]
MAGKAIFRKSFRGYKVADVNKYLDDIIRDYYKVIADKDAEIARLKEQNSASAKASKIANEQIKDVHEKAKYIITTAELEARGIIAQANSDAIVRQQELQQQISSQQTKLKILQAELAGLKKLAKSSLQKFEDEIDKLHVEEAV